MKIYRTNGEIVELNTTEYRELFIENAPVGCGGNCSMNCKEHNSETGYQISANFEEIRRSLYGGMLSTVTESKEVPEPVPAEPVRNSDQFEEPAPERAEPKQESGKPVFEIAPTSEQGRGGKGGQASYPIENKSDKPNPSDLLEPEPSAGGKNKKKLDDGKIAALRRAGWTFEKIADEMGCSAQTALNHYNAYIRNMGKKQA